MSSVIDQIIHTAAKLSQAGITPSTATVKAKMGGKIPMPQLIEGMARFKALSSEEVTQAAKVMIGSDDKPSTAAETARADDIQQQLNQLQHAYKTLSERVAALEAKLDGIA
ncbi:hypothetical protein [Shewanella sp.]|uniref:hypothetical protein n=1 Tax=Shewanella sp. TaxID=50422 RepID=UPI003A972FA4